MEHKSRIFAILLTLALAATITACSAAKGTSAPVEASATVTEIDSKAEEQSAPEATGEESHKTTFGTHYEISNNTKFSLNEKTYKAFVKLLDGKTFTAGEKIDFSVVTHTEDENESFDKACKMFAYLGDYDKESHTVTITKNTSYTLSFENEKLDVYINS